MASSPTHTDVLVVGAGISGIDAAYHLKNHTGAVPGTPGRSFAVLERRAALGGTWDFFKYPGIRSDSDMFTFGFAWAPWPDNKVIAPADDILRYLHAVVRDHDLARHIEYGVDVQRAEFSSATGLWTLTTEGGGSGGAGGGSGSGGGGSSSSGSSSGSSCRSAAFAILLLFYADSRFPFAM